MRQSHHTNVGACFRSAAAMGVDAVLVTPRCGVRGDLLSARQSEETTVLLALLCQPINAGQGPVSSRQTSGKNAALNRSAASISSAVVTWSSPLVTASLPSSVRTHVTETDAACGSFARMT